MYHSKSAIVDEAILFSRSPFPRMDCGTCVRIPNWIEKQHSRGQCTRRHLNWSWCSCEENLCASSGKKKTCRAAHWYGLVRRTSMRGTCGDQSFHSYTSYGRCTNVTCVLYLMATVKPKYLEGRTIYNFYGVAMESSTVFHVSLVPRCRPIVSDLEFSVVRSFVS